MSSRLVVLAVRLLAVLLALYLGLIAVRSDSMVRAETGTSRVLFFVGGTTTARLLSAWWSVTAALVPIGFALTLRRRDRMAAASVLVAVAGVGAAESIAWRQTHFLERWKVTIERMRPYGQAQALSLCAGYGLMEEIVIPASDVGLQDGWGHPFVYKRITPSVALLVAPGPDGKVSRRLDTAEVDPHDLMFPGFAQDRDIVMRIEQGNAQFIASPWGAGPAAKLLLGNVYP